MTLSLMYSDRGSEAVVDPPCLGAAEIETPALAALVPPTKPHRLRGPRRRSAVPGAPVLAQLRALRQSLKYFTPWQRPRGLLGLGPPSPGQAGQSLSPPINKTLS